VVLDDTILGYVPQTAGARPNLADVLMMASIGQMGEEGGAACFTGSASGPARSPTIKLSAATTQCAWLSALTSTSATLHHAQDWWVAELRLTEGTYLGSGVSPQGSSYYGQRGFRISADAGVDGAAGISYREVAGCQN
jgi:hypothetical protein